MCLRLSASLLFRPPAPRMALCKAVLPAESIADLVSCCAPCYACTCIAKMCRRVLACGKVRRQEPQEGKRAKEEFIPAVSMSCKLDTVFFSSPGTHTHTHTHARERFISCITKFTDNQQLRKQNRLETRRIDLRMLSSTSSVSCSFCYQMVATGIED